ncbi:MAG: hypothetical protein R3C52_07535 [Hyphomonadaceae bacterium]
MHKLERQVPLPEAMQGRWKTVADQEELAITGGEIHGFGKVVEYDWKMIEEIDGALCVQLGVNDTSLEGQDAFAAQHITNLVITPDGEFHVYNVKFSEQLEKFS